MNNKEAIEWLVRVITLHKVEDMNVTLTDRREYEAIDLAIKGLEFIEENVPKTFNDYLIGGRE